MSQLENQQWSGTENTHQLQKKRRTAVTIRKNPTNDQGVHVKTKPKKFKRGKGKLEGNTAEKTVKHQTQNRCALSFSKHGKWCIVAHQQRLQEKSCLSDDSKGSMKLKCKFSTLGCIQKECVFVAATAYISPSISPFTGYFYSLYCYKLT